VRLFSSPRTFLQTLGHASHQVTRPRGQSPVTWARGWRRGRSQWRGRGLRTGGGGGGEGKGAEEGRGGGGGGGRSLETVAVGASMPALGLSQTPIYASRW